MRTPYVKMDRTRTDGEIDHIHIPPANEKSSTAPKKVASQLAVYLDTNFSKAEDKAGPDYQFLSDWKAALENLNDLTRNRTIALEDRVEHIYPLCKVLSRKLVLGQNNNRVGHWRHLAIQIRFHRQYSYTKWWAHYQALRQGYPQANQVSFITCQAITIHDLICANSLRP
jgi:hypothetical protein